MRAAYNGHEPLTFGDFIDLATGRTLRAEPGQVYDITPASGHTVDDVPAPWFTAIEGEPPAVEDPPALDESWAARVQAIGGGEEAGRVRAEVADLVNAGQVDAGQAAAIEAGIAARFPVPGGDPETGEPPEM